MQAGHHQHMREPGGPEHFIQFAAQCAFVPKGGGARHAAHLLAQQARQRAAQFLPQLPRSAGKAALAPHHGHLLRRGVQVYAVCPACAGIACVFRGGKFQLCRKDIALRQPGHGLQICVEARGLSIHLCDVHGGVHTAGQVAGCGLPHHGLHLRRGARKRPGGPHNRQGICPAPRKGKGGRRTAQHSGKAAPPGRHAPEHRKGPCAKSRRQPKGRQRHKSARKAGQAERKAKAIYRAAHQSWKNRGSGARKVMSPRSAASPSASTAARATTVQSHFETSASSACRLPPVEITSSAITTRLPCI